jgi:hypothetical protein
MAAGSSTPRTTVASMRMASAMPSPSILYSMADSVTKTVKTLVMMSAALAAMPPTIASRGDAPASQRSLTLLRMKMC